MPLLHFTLPSPFILTYIYTLACPTLSYSTPLFTPLHFSLLYPAILHFIHLCHTIPSPHCFTLHYPNPTYLPLPNSTQPCPPLDPSLPSLYPRLPYPALFHSTLYSPPLPFTPLAVLPYSTPCHSTLPYLTLRGEYCLAKPYSDILRYGDSVL